MDIEANVERMKSLPPTSSSLSSRIRDALDENTFLDDLINGDQPIPSGMSSLLSSQINDVAMVTDLSQQLEEYTGHTDEFADTTYNAVAFRGNLLNNPPHTGNLLLKRVLISMLLITTMPKCDLSNEHTRNTIIFISLAGAMALK